MGKRITAAEATTLCDNFDKKYTALCTVTKDDNRSGLFSIDELQDYINYIKKTEGIDGVRIYLGSYGANEGKKSNLTTVFLAPTSDGEDNTTLDALNYSDPGKPTSKKYGK